MYISDSWLDHMFCGQIVAGVSAPDQEQRGGASLDRPAPGGFERRQHGHPRCRQHPAAGYRGQPDETECFIKM